MGLTELTLISAGMVKLLYLVMRVGAVLIEASFLTHFLAFDMIVRLEVGPAVVVLVVIGETEILIMRIYIDPSLHYFLHWIDLNVMISNLKNSENLSTLSCVLGWMTYSQ